MSKEIHGKYDRIIQEYKEENEMLRGRQCLSNYIIMGLFLISTLSMGTCQIRNKDLRNVRREKATLQKKVSDLMSKNQELIQENKMIKNIKEQLILLQKDSLNK